jgi:hypothetical protein
VIRLAGTVTYRDGRTEEIEVTQAEYAGFELWAMRNGIPATPDSAPPMTMQRYLGYQATQRTAHHDPAAWQAWEAWDSEVIDVTLEAEDGSADAAVNPTPAVRSAG